MANETIIKNLENQLQRLVQQSADLEECKNDLTEEEYESMKDETLEQIKEFTGTLDRLNKGDVTLNSKISSMRDVIRKAIANSFNTLEMIRIAGDQSLNEQANRLASLEESYQLKKISTDEYNNKKREVLLQLVDFGYTLSLADKKFLDNQTDSEILENLRSVDDGLN
ncbi:protein LZIC-like [Sitodiplosis mosellana]|uniref:protein LZIC-like n=1 Tax=Sitodiplosis mosellana TaxID=263140 RepID=UPI002443AA20|nr:protein LZIC-like [Sitodiplosis mosellana]